MSFLDDINGLTADPFMTIGEGGQERWAEMNKGVTPVFHMMPVEDPAATEKEGRPMFKDVEMLRIFVAGDPGTQVTSPVTVEYKERFADAYAAFKAKKEGEEDKIPGTPLRQWPPISPAKIKEFEGIHIFNVEGLANLPETTLQKFQGLREWKNKAVAWLANAKDGAFAIEMMGENDRLKADMADMRKQMAEMKASMDEQAPKRGRAA